MCGVCDNVRFIRERDGAEAAQRFAERTAKSYRKAVRDVRGRVLRPELIRAYKVAKKAAR